MNRLLLLLMTITLLACGGGSDVAGGSDLPNGIITGVVVASDGSKAPDASVELSGIKLTPRGDSVSWNQKTQTNHDGEYEFTNVPENDYIIKATLNSGETAMISHVTKNAEKLNMQPLNTSKNVVLKGRVLGYGATHVFIPGTGRATDIQPDGFYVLDNVPRGELALTICGGLSMNVLKFQIDPSADRDTFYIRDANFVSGGIQYNYHSSREKVYFTFPELYTNSAKPTWYYNRDFSGITYYSKDENTLWHFPIEVVITKATENLYLDINYIKSQIIQQINEANAKFDDERFKGTVLFSVDSFKILVSTTLPPFDKDKYSVRLVYDETGIFSSPTPWNELERTFILSGDQYVNTDFFGEKYLRKVTYGLALSRGCENLFQYDVTYDQNGVNGHEYHRDELLLWGTSGDTWDEQSIELINRNGSKYGATETISSNDYPKNMYVKVLENGQPVEGAELRIYGLNKESGIVNTSPRYDHYTDNQGYYKFTENPFLEGDNPSPFNSFLIHVSHNNKTLSRWIPAFEIRGDYYRDQEESITIEMNM